MTRTQTNNSTKIRTTKCVFVSVLTIIQLLVLSSHAQTGTKYLTIGESLFINSIGNGPIKISKTGILKISEVPDGFILKAKNPGSSKVRYNGRETLYIVTPKVPQALKSFVNKIPGLSLSMVNHRIRAKGEHLLFTDLLRWNELKHKTPYLEDKTTISKPLIQIIKKKLEQINRDGTFLRAELSQDQEKTILIYKDGKLHSERDLVATQEQMKAWGFQFKIVEQSISNQFYTLKLVFAEIKNNFNQSTGISWPNNLPLDLLSQDFKVSKDYPLQGIVNAIESKGFGQIHASPTLRLQLGKPTELHSGGEIPIKVSGYRSQRLYWKKYGLIVKVLPNLLGRKIQVKIDLELSRVDSSQVVDGTPGFITQRSHSELLTLPGEVNLISGLIRKEWGNSRSGLAFLSRIPLLGKLFSSQDFLEDRSQLIILAKLEG